MLRYNHDEGVEAEEAFVDGDVRLCYFWEPRTGVSIGVITVTASERDSTIGETLDAIHELRMDDELYEERNDRLRVT